MRHSAVWAVAGWAIGFGLLIAATYLLTWTSYHAALEQIALDEIVRSAHQYSISPDALTKGK
jgi:hypothetical protein